MLIELTDDLWIESDNVTAVRRSTLDEDQTILFCVGQSAIDGGFTVDRPLEEVVEALKEARYMSIVADLETQEKSLEPQPGA
jgi:hypothetical protein